MQQGYAMINGTRLYYEVAGAGAPVALAHGFTLDHRMWDEQFLALAERYRVVRYDLRGFGRSDLPTAEPYAHYADLRALLGFLGLGATAIIGLSMGGGVATNFALAYPELTSALVLIDAAIDGHRWSPEWREQMALIGRDGREVGTTAAKERWLAHGLFAPALEQPAVGAQLARMVGDYSGWHWVNRDSAQGLTPTAIDRLGEISAPTLALLGERDLPDFHTILARLQAQAAQAQIGVIPNAGHMANMEAPTAVNRYLLAFLGNAL